MWLPPSQELQATVKTEAKNMPSVTFFRMTWHVRTVRLLWTSSMKVPYGFIMYFLYLKISHHLLKLFGKLLLPQCFVG